MAAGLIRYADEAREAEEAGGSPGSLEEFDRRLLAANWIMARRLEPMASRILLGLPEEGDAAEAAQIVATAQAQLQRAAQLWAEHSVENGPDSEDEQRRQRREHLEALRAFGRAFAALWPSAPVEEERHEEVLREAASGLSIVLDAERSDVAAAATLWQAYLYARGGRQERALDLLPLALKPLKYGDRSGYYARLLRCRLLVEQGGGASAALALLTRIEESCGEWFDAKTAQDQARGTARLLRRQTAAGWAETLQKENKPQLAAWCHGLVDRLDQGRNGHTPDALLRLEYAIPALVNLDQLARALTELGDSQRPATEPEETSEERPGALP